ncbi:PucR family transcriptional regulator ligand-binding domain-containing protein [Cryptosporangium sp. NPDC051539]|uniref:PucR family transcriptional regulator ligand-binding domain-containing protein n=1 Tax=Cryptosporangium sp. NPDC051539 TaxID=3363962 RepID=UPI00379EEB74
MLTLAEVLQFEAVRDARPEVLTGHDVLDRPVRWVHSSEIYEIGPLLSGGELLLTTGLGLAGSDAGARRHYVRELTDAGVSALALELGRSFPDIPPELVDEAARRHLPLIALHAVVPFIRMCEAANTAIVDEAARRLRLGDRVTRALNDALISGAGVAGLLRTAADVAGAAVVLTTASGALVASYGVPDDHAAWRAVDSAAAGSEVIVHGRSWGSWWPRRAPRSRRRTWPRPSSGPRPRSRWRFCAPVTRRPSASGTPPRSSPTWSAVRRPRRPRPSSGPASRASARRRGGC